ncbi:MAG: UDP-glucose 4-epimerase GalE [Acidobacteriaceae bacterium]|nr:UDP-glucose 4-epimerase GalE [Acidobacteriaceae bacterium]
MDGLPGTYSEPQRASRPLHSNCLAKILVTGGAGYIGSITRYFLEKRGHSVIVVDNLLRGHREMVPEKILRVTDLRETDKLERLMKDEQIEAVVHFAAYIAVGESTQIPEQYFLNNVGGSLSLFDAMLRAGVKRIVFSSTAAAYGIPERVPITEDQPYAPINPYGDSKVMTEKILEWLDRYRGMRSIRLRYFNACGAEPEAGLGELHDPETHLLPLLIRAIQTGRPMTLFGDDYPTPDGTCIRDYIHVSDLAEAHIFAVEHLLRDRASDVFNVGTGAGHSVKEMLAAVERVTGQRVPHTIGPRREGDPPSLVADSQKLQNTLGWKPKRDDLDRIVADSWRFAQAYAERQADKIPG